MWQKGIKSFKKGMSDDSSYRMMTLKLILTIQTPIINNQNASNWLVRDISSCYQLQY